MPALKSEAKAMIIGLTGSIASGKSTVSEMLKKRGYPIVDADAIARQVVEKESPVLVQIVEVFGNDVLQVDGSLNRPKLGEVVFQNAEKRKQLNSIIHPAIRQEMIRQKEHWLRQGATTVIMDIPLLFESKLQSYVDQIVVVSVTPEIQLKRLMARNQFTEEEALARIHSQLPMQEKEQGADAVINNNHSMGETERQLDAILKQWKVLPFIHQV